MYALLNEIVNVPPGPRLQYTTASAALLQTVRVGGRTRTAAQSAALVLLALCVE